MVEGRGDGHKFTEKLEGLMWKGGEMATSSLRSLRG